MQAQGKHQEALEHVQGPGAGGLVIAAERGALEGRLLVRLVYLIPESGDTCSTALAYSL